MKNYFFKASSNIMSFITEIIILYSVLNIKNINILHESVIKIRNAISVQFQNTMITAVFFETN